jgi:hypothetical protein
MPEKKRGHEMTKEMKAAAVKNETKKHDDSRYLSYFLENERYALELLKVQEIKGCMGLVPAIQAPDQGRQTSSFKNRASKRISGN